jgi:hypothetical protein
VVVLTFVLGALIVFAIAAVLLGRETGRLGATPPRPVYDVDEAVVWVADHLPDAVTAELSHAELRRVLLCAADHLRLLAAEQRVASEDERVAHVTAIVDLPERQVRAVLAVQTEYLTLIGAASAVPSLPPERGGGPAEEFL